MNPPSQKSKTVEIATQFSCVYQCASGSRFSRLNWGGMCALKTDGRMRTGKPPQDLHVAPPAPRALCYPAPRLCATFHRRELAASYASRVNTTPGAVSLLQGARLPCVIPLAELEWRSAKQLGSKSAPTGP